MGRQNAVRQASHQVQQYTPRLRSASEQNLHQPHLPRSSRDCKSKQRSALKTVPNGFVMFMLRFLQHYTPLVWLAALSILIGSATAAVTTILDPNASVPYGVSRSPALIEPLQPTLTAGALTAEQLATSVPTKTYVSTAEDIRSPAAQRSEDSPNLIQAQATHPTEQLTSKPSTPASPQSAVGAIVLSCAVGCFLLSQWLKPKKTARRRVLLEPAHASLSQKIPTVKVQPVEAPPASKSTAIPATETTLSHQLPAASSISFNLLNAAPVQPAKPAQAEPASTTVDVTVLPAEQSHPLDWNEPSLADSLDLRQRRPLSYWL